jgi:hypothetical protein
MRLGGGNDNDFIDRTGQSGGGFPVMGGGGGLLGLLIPLVLSRFGFVGLLILALGYCALGGLGGGGMMGGSTAPTQQAGAGAANSTLSPEVARDLEIALNNTDQVWTEFFQAAGQRYTQPRLVAYLGGTSTACGQGSGADGAFLLPGRPDHLHRSELLQRTPHPLRRTGRFRALLRDRARGRAPHPEPRRHARQGEPRPGLAQQGGGQCGAGRRGAAGGLLRRRVGGARQGARRHPRA